MTLPWDLELCNGPNGLLNWWWWVNMEQCIVVVVVVVVVKVVFVVVAGRDRPVCSVNFSRLTTQWTAWYSKLHRQPASPQPTRTEVGIEISFSVDPILFFHILFLSVVCQFFKYFLRLKMEMQYSSILIFYHYVLFSGWVHSQWNVREPGDILRCFLG